MLDLLGQVTYETSTSSSGDAGAVMALLAGLWLIILPLLVFMIVCMWKVFAKAGVEGWKSIIPIYNNWVLAEIAGKPGWWGLNWILAFVPIVGSIAALVVQVILAIELSKKFGKEPAFGLLVAFLPIIGYAILAFGDATYNGVMPADSSAANSTGTPSAPAA